MNIYRCTLLALLIASSNAVIGADDSQKLALLLQPIQSMSANFTQQLFDIDGTELESFQGVDDYKALSVCSVAFKLGCRVFRLGHLLGLLT